VLQKGLCNDLARSLKRVLLEVDMQFGVYSFQNSNADVLYCGSFSPYVTERSSLWGRMKNYLCNHRVRKGQRNTNKRLFDLINSRLREDSISINVLAQGQIEWKTNDRTSARLSEFLNDPGKTKLMERILIEYYRLDDKAQWHLD